MNMRSFATLAMMVIATCITDTADGEQVSQVEQLQEIQNIVGQICDGSNKDGVDAVNTTALPDPSFFQECYLHGTQNRCVTVHPPSIQISAETRGITIGEQGYAETTCDGYGRCITYHSKDSVKVVGLDAAANVLIL